MRRDARNKTLLLNLNLTNNENSEEIQQGKALAKLRKCLNKGFYQSSPEIQNGLIEFLRLTFPSFKYLLRLLSKDEEASKLKIYQLFQSMKIQKKNQGFQLLAEHGSFDYMYILLAGSVAIQSKQEQKSFSLYQSEVKPTKQLKKKLLNKSLQDIHYIQIKFRQHSVQISQLSKIIAYRRFYLNNRRRQTQKNCKYICIIWRQNSDFRWKKNYFKLIQFIFILFQVVVNEDFTELIQAPIKIFQKAFLHEIDLQEVREKVKVLKQLSYFSEINTRVLSNLFVNSEIIKMVRGQYLYKQNDILDWKALEKKKMLNIFFYIVRKGTLRVTQTTKINIDNNESIMNPKIKKHETDIYILSEGQIVGMEEIINQSPYRYSFYIFSNLRLNSVISNSNETQLYQIAINDIKEKLQKVMASQSKTKLSIEEYLKTKLDLEEEIGEKIKQGTFYYHHSLSKNNSEVNFNEMNFDKNEEPFPYINIKYQDSVKRLNKTLDFDTNQQSSQPKLSKTITKENSQIYIRSQNDSESSTNQYSNIIQKKNKVLSSLRVKDNSQRQNKEKFGEFNFTKDLYNVRTLKGSNQILDTQSKQQSKHQSNLGYISQKLSRDFSAEMNFKSENDLSLIALNKYFQKTLSREKKRSHQWQLMSLDERCNPEKSQSQAIINLKRKLKKSRKEKLNKIVLKENNLKIENQIVEK